MVAPKVTPVYSMRLNYVLYTAWFYLFSSICCVLFISFVICCYLFLFVCFVRYCYFNSLLRVIGESSDYFAGEGLEDKCDFFLWKLSYQ